MPRALSGVRVCCASLPGDHENETMHKIKKDILGRTTAQTKSESECSLTEAMTNESDRVVECQVLSGRVAANTLKFAPRPEDPWAAKH
eukprot:920101-Pyramimonas_sp.AAC.1